MGSLARRLLGCKGGIGTTSCPSRSPPVLARRSPGGACCLDLDETCRLCSASSDPSGPGSSVGWRRRHRSGRCPGPTGAPWLEASSLSLAGGPRSGQLRRGRGSGRPSRSRPRGPWWSRRHRPAGRRLAIAAAAGRSLLVLRPATFPCGGRSRLRYAPPGSCWWTNQDGPPGRTTRRRSSGARCGAVVASTPVSPGLSPGLLVHRLPVGDGSGVWSGRHDPVDVASTSYLPTLFGSSGSTPDSWGPSCRRPRLGGLPRSNARPRSAIRILGVCVVRRGCHVGLLASPSVSVGSIPSSTTVDHQGHGSTAQIATSGSNGWSPRSDSPSVSTSRHRSWSSGCRSLGLRPIVPPRSSTPAFPTAPGKRRDSAVGHRRSLLHHPAPSGHGRSDSTRSPGAPVRRWILAWAVVPVSRRGVRGNRNRKSPFLNALAACIRPASRLITIADSADCDCPHDLCGSSPARLNA